MLLLRLGAILAAISVVVALALFFLTRDRRYLRFSYKLVTWTLAAALLMLALLALERLIVLV